MGLKGLFLTTSAISLVITAICLKFIIPVLASHKMGQKILEIGPRWHKSKEGTPTMGGVSFILATIIAFIVFLIVYRGKIEGRNLCFALNIIVYALLNAMIGIIDDIAKLRKEKNEGLTPLAKFSFQSVVAILFLVSMHFTIGISTSLYIPFVDKYIELGYLYYVLCYIALCGVVNSVNLTDGIDGLASGVCLSVGVFFAVVGLSVIKEPTTVFFSAVIIGGMLGFLIYNFYPARVFMGDTGSLFLGALVVSVSFLIDNILLVLVYGFVFVCEALSVVLQVAYFKMTKGKRLLKMAPLHHHFEKCGLTEIQIVIAFVLLNSLFCTVAYFGLGNL